MDCYGNYQNEPLKKIRKLENAKPIVLNVENEAPISPMRKNDDDFEYVGEEKDVDEWKRKKDCECVVNRMIDELATPKSSKKIIAEQRMLKIKERLDLIRNSNYELQICSINTDELKLLDEPNEKRVEYFSKRIKTENFSNVADPIIVKKDGDQYLVISGKIERKLIAIAARKQ
ncbi:unnamed protein product [Caenorhabditis angaria]|uniref:Uncharacterized protein n=1 Tax=Caenorhabditis angaria TaxID=860376 RepID=A0A9P1MSJ6_9PELO|nr:unnamed protein product [Caenorhabditis angaria]